MVKIFESSPLFKTVKIIWTSSPKWTVLRLLVSAVTNVLPLFTLFLLKGIIDEVENILDGPPEQGLTEVYLYFFIWLGVSGLTGILTQILRYIKELHDHRVSLSIQTRLHEKAMNLPFKYFDSSRYHDMLHRAQRESVNKPQKLAEDLSSLTGNAIALLGILAIFASLNIWISILLLLIGVPTLLSQRRFSKGLFTHKIKVSADERMGIHLSRVLTQRIYAQELRIFGAGNTVQTLFKNLKERLYQDRLGHVKRLLRDGSISVVLEFILFGSLLFYLLYQTQSGLFTLGAFVMYIQAFLRGQQQLKTLFQKLLSIFESKLFLGHLVEFLELQEEELSNQDGKRSMEVIDTLEMKKVSFQYPESDEKALNEISFQVKKGELIGVVGENGSGKSTLLKLISGLYEPGQGDFLINNGSIQDVGVNNFRKEISIVAQDYAQYMVNAGFNIALETNNWDQEKMDQSINFSGLGGIIQGLDKGLQTVLGKEFFAGRELSGGQWQRFALARGIYKKASVLVLDEPTSHIDGLSSLSFFEDLKSFSKNQITFLVSHQLSHLKNCSSIWLMENGQIVEKATYDEMKQNSPRFIQLFSGQIIK